MEPVSLMTSVTMRDLSRDDFSALSAVLEGTGLFPSEMLPEMAQPYLDGTAEHLWIVAAQDDAVIGFAYVEPERMTEGTHNLLAMAVLPERQGSGVGHALVREVERRLAAAGGRVLLVETSTLDQYTATRSFYERQDFEREATIRDFYAEGEGKVVFWKRLH